jgi:ribulose-phosphate 3-epimerase
MIQEPLDKLEAYAAAGADIITVHVEAAVHIHRVLQRLGTLEHGERPGEGIVRGLALNPGTPLEWLNPLLDEIDIVTILAIDPGWSGQTMAPGTLRRVARAKKMGAAAGKEILVSVDGGVNRGNIAAIAAAGADLVVTGSAVFDGKTAEANARFMLGELHAL